MFTKLMREEKGQTMVEYGLLVALVSIIVVAALVLTGPLIRDFFVDVNTCLTNPNAANCAPAPAGP